MAEALRTTLYAVTNAKTWKLCVTRYGGPFSIWSTRKQALNDCAPGQVVRVLKVKMLPDIYDVRGILSDKEEER